jgi:hypothetical protein
MPAANIRFSAMLAEGYILILLALSAQQKALAVVHHTIEHSNHLTN